MRRRGLGRRPATGLLVLVLGLTVGWAVLGGGSVDSPGVSEVDDDRLSELGDAVTGSGDAALPGPLVAAERYVAEPGADNLRALVDAVGGVDAIVVGQAEGVFDLVRFDPLDPDRLIASARSSYGKAQNQGINEIWEIEPEGLTQALLAADTPHDFAHFNRDGTITMWVNAEAGESFAPRTATLFDRARRATVTSESLFASRFTAADGTIFALTGDGDYYSNSNTYEQLIAEGVGHEVLDTAESYEWIDSPAPGLLVAYPNGPQGATAVWNTVTLDRLPEHPLADHPYQRVAVSGDQRTAVGVTFEGQMEQVDLAAGRVLSVFGALDPRGIDQPVTVNDDGSVAVTVDRSGAVTLWWVGDDNPVATIEADAVQPRWVSARYGARSASTVAASAGRLALRSRLGPQTPTTWTIVDIDIDDWIERACTLSGRPLTVDERTELGLGGPSAACV